MFSFLSSDMSHAEWIVRRYFMRALTDWFGLSGEATYGIY